MQIPSAKIKMMILYPLIEILANFDSFNFIDNPQIPLTKIKG